MTARPGFALVLSLLLVLALAVLGTGMLAVGTREQWVAAALARRTQAERRAEAAAVQAVRRWSTRSVADMALGEMRTLTVAPGTGVSVERADSALFLVRAEARVAGPTGETGVVTGLLVRVLHPLRLAVTFPGALTADTVALAPGGVVDGMATCGAPGPGVLGPDVSVDPAAVVSGDPAVSLTTPPGAPTPDPFAPELAAGLADLVHASPTAAPRPAETTGACLADASNWGSPDPGHPCHDLRPVILAADLTVDGGVGFGVLIVDGDLRVTGGARLDGLVVVRGALRLDAGTTLRGAVRARSAEIAGTIIRDGCALADVLSAPALDRPFRTPDRWWIPLF